MLVYICTVSDHIVRRNDDIENNKIQSLGSSRAMLERKVVSAKGTMLGLLYLYL